MYQKIVIISGGCPVDAAYFNKKTEKDENTLMICCDGGVRHFNNLSIRPDVIIGDMDSIDPVQLKYYSRQGVKIIHYPANKDFTDTELALDYALNLKPQKISIWCALGGRIDHTLSNVYLVLKGQEKGIETYLIDEYCEIFLVHKVISFIKETGKTVSLLAITPEVTGITTTGFLYPLEKGNLKIGESKGISNIINDNRATINVEKGKLLVIKYHKKNHFPEAI